MPLKSTGSFCVWRTGTCGRWGIKAYFVLPQIWHKKKKKDKIIDVTQDLEQDKLLYIILVFYLI